MPWWNYFNNPLFWILMVSGFLLILVIGALFLAIALEAIEGKNTGFRDIFVTNLIGVAFNYIPLIGITLYCRNVVRRHETGWDGAITLGSSPGSYRQ
jgi:biotin transporter BioY